MDHLIAQLYYPCDVNGVSYEEQLSRIEPELKRLYQALYRQQQSKRQCECCKMMQRFCEEQQERQELKKKLILGV